MEKHITSEELLFLLEVLRAEQKRSDDPVRKERLQQLINAERLPFCSTYVLKMANEYENVLVSREMEKRQGLEPIAGWEKSYGEAITGWKTAHPDCDGKDLDEWVRELCDRLEGKNHG